MPLKRLNERGNPVFIRRTNDIKSSDITDKKVYLERRRFLQVTSAAALAAVIGNLAPAGSSPGFAQGREKLEGVGKSPLSTDEPLTPYEDITTYNNFYEFDTDKYAPAKLAKNFRAKPWSVAVEGEVDKPAVYQLEDLIKPSALEERVYRLRCVEGWSMVIPWVGFPLSDVIKRFEPTSKAKFVEFTTLLILSRCRATPLCPQVAVCRRSAYGRGHAPIDHPGRGALWRSASQSERRPFTPGRPLEVWLQEHQVDRQDALCRAAAGRFLGTGRLHKSMGSTPMSIRRYPTRAGVKPVNDASANCRSARP